MLRQLPEGSALEKRLVEYMCWAFNIELDALGAVVREAKPERWEPIMGSIAETLIERGKTEGIAKGRAEGKAEGLFRLLTRRFGPLPHELERQLAGASATELDVWLDNFLEASSLEAVFGQAQT